MADVREIRDMHGRATSHCVMSDDGFYRYRLDDPDPERPEDERCHGHVLQRLMREVCGDG